MRKILAAILICTLIALPAPVFATSDRVNVETLTFDKIEQHMNTYNAQIYSNNDKVAAIEVPSADTKAALEGMLAIVVAQISSYNAKIAGLDGHPDAVYLIDIYNALKATSVSNKASLESQINSFDENRNKASDARSKAYLQTEMGNKMVIWGAEQLFLGYNSLEHQIKQQRSQLFLLQKQLFAMELRQKLGMVTKSTYKSLEAGVKELQFAVNAMTDQQSMMKDQLNIMLNQNYDTDLKIEAIPELDRDLLDEMNFEEDYKNAQWRSYNVMLKDDSWEREAEQRKFELDFKKSHENVLAKQESLELEEYKLENTRETFVHTQLRYKLGLISKISFEEQQTTFENQRLKIQIAKEDLFKAYRQYEWMKKGFTL